MLDSLKRGREWVERSIRLSCGGRFRVVVGMSGWVTVKDCLNLIVSRTNWAI
jgi:hypothetical protein